MPSFSPAWAPSLGLAVLLISGCSRGHEAPQQAAPAAKPAPAPAQSTDPNDTGRPKIVVLGDSLSAGLGLLEMQAYPALLQEKLNAEGYQWEVVNSGISGDTSAAGLQRTEWALSQGDVRILILELGANDGLRGLPVADIRANLDAIVTRSQQAGARILLVGMRIPPNYGPVYSESFRAQFPEVATRHRAAFVPFLLQTVALDEALIQPDGLHPNAAAQPKLLDTVWPHLEPLLRSK